MMKLKNMEGLLLVSGVLGGVFLIWRGGSAFGNAVSETVSAIGSGAKWTGHKAAEGAKNAGNNIAAGTDWAALFLTDPIGTYKLAKGTNSAQLTAGAQHEMDTIDSILTPRFGANWRQRMDNDPALASEYTAYLYSQGYYTNKQPSNGQASNANTHSASPASTSAPTTQNGLPPGIRL